MEKLQIIVPGLSRGLGIIAGVTLMFIMLLTVLDVILRYFGTPIMGVYDIVSIGGAIVIGFSMPLAAEKKVHVYMEMIVQKQGRTLRRVLNLVTRLILFGISSMVAWNLIRLGMTFHETGQVSLTIKIAYYPIAIGLGICFIIQMFVYLLEILRVFPRSNNE